jgi:hypothetical protein
LPPEVTGVRLRPWRVEDAGDIAVMAHDDHVRRWSSLPDDVEAWLVRKRAEARGRGLAHDAVVAMLRAIADTTDVRSVVLDIEEGNAASSWTAPAWRGRSWCSC